MYAVAVALPGQVLGSVPKSKPGAGTHLRGAEICASYPGIVSQSSQSSAQNSGGSSTENVTISVLRTTRPESGAALSSSLPTRTVLPTVDATVLARVTRINPRQATVEIIVVEESACVDGWQGLIRVQDIRATEKDKVRVVDSFRPGDVVRAVVISLGDQSNYYLSTASNQLGVIMATSETGNAMYPMSWKEFHDPVTGRTELRKVAKPF